MLTRRFALLSFAASALPLGACTSNRSEEDVIKLVKAGRIADAQRVAERRAAMHAAVNGDERLLAATLTFATGAYPEAWRQLDQDYESSRYLAGDPTALNADILRTNLDREGWRHLAAQRTHIPIANPWPIPLLGLAAGWQTVDQYAAEQARGVRADLADTTEREHRCTGNLVLAEMALARDDQAAARPLLTAATADALPELVDYYVAVEELKRLS